MRSFAALSHAAMIFGYLLVGCGFQTYQPQALQPEHLVANYLAHDPTSAAFREFLIASGYPEAQIPIQHWGLRELTLSAL